MIRQSSMKREKCKRFLDAHLIAGRWPTLTGENRGWKEGLEGWEGAGKKARWMVTLYKGKSIHLQLNITTLFKG